MTRGKRSCRVGRCFNAYADKPGHDAQATGRPYFNAHAACAGHDDQGRLPARLNLPAACTRPSAHDHTQDGRQMTQSVSAIEVLKAPFDTRQVLP